jgi:hypothetical protein
MRILIASIACACASFAAAGAIRFEPPNANPHTSVDATVSAVWHSSCAPVPGGVSIAGSTIAIHVKDLPLETLIVRDTLHVSPYVVPATGGSTVFVTNPFFPDIATVTIGSVVLESHSTGPTLSFVAPPHAPGSVDVTVSRGNESVTAKAALIYDDPASPDPRAFEPTLFPIAYDGAGAFGSRWTTDNFAVLASGWAFRDHPPCSCSGGFPGIFRLANASSPWGLVLYALRGTIDKTTFVSRIRENVGNRKRGDGNTGRPRARLSRADDVLRRSSAADRPPRPVPGVGARRARNDALRHVASQRGGSNAAHSGRRDVVRIGRCNGVHRGRQHRYRGRP